MYLADFKKMHSVSCELNFIWGNMKTTAWETAPPIALRNCSKEVGGKVSVYVIVLNGEYIQSALFFFFVENFRWYHKASGNHENECHHKRF